MPVTIGIHRIAFGADYSDFAAYATALNATPVLTGDVTLIIYDDMLAHPKAVFDGIDFNNFSISIINQYPPEGVARNGYKTELTSNAELIQFKDCFDGTVNITGLNVLQTTTTEAGPTKRMLAFTGTQNIAVNLDDCILQGGGHGTTGLYFTSTSAVQIANCEIVGLRDSGNPGDGYAIEQGSADPIIIVENCVMHDVGTVFRISDSAVFKATNNLLLGADNDLVSVPGPSNNGIGRNNGTTKGSSLGFSSEVATATLLVPADELYSTDPTSFNYLKARSTGVIGSSGIAASLLEINFNTAGIRGNVRGLNGTTSIGADEAVPRASAELRYVPPQAAPSTPATNLVAESLTKQLPDRGQNFIEARLFIKDHGKESEADAGRDPEWVDFTEFAGRYRLTNIADIISVGTEGVKPYRFKASTVTLKLDNADFAWDNLPGVDFKTVEGNDALFLKTAKGTNIDLRERPAKLTAKFPKEEMTVSYDMNHYNVGSIQTDSKGVATMKLESLEKQFIEMDADTVKDGKNWYFNRSVKFLVEELIKSVRRRYADSQEDLVGSDSVSVAGLETSDGARVFSDHGRPIADVKPIITGVDKGMKQLIVTAAVPRNIFQSTLQGNVSAGSNYIRMRFDEALVIKKGDVFTLGNGGATNFDGLNEEKVTVLEDITFSGTPNYPPEAPAYEVLNIKVSQLKKDHVKDEIIERWIAYLGCSRDIEDREENYVVSFDPDRDAYANVFGVQSTLSGDYVLSSPPRFLHLKQTLHQFYNKPGPATQHLLCATAAYTYPGRPNEEGSLYVWEIETDQRWDAQHLYRKKGKDVGAFDGGIYTGELNYRSMKAVLTNEDLGVTVSGESSNALFGAQGVGKFVEDVLHLDGTRSLGFGYMAGLSSDVGSGSDLIDVSTVANGTNLWAVQKVVKGVEEIFSGTVYLIGGEENSSSLVEGIGENFNYFAGFFSARIESAQRISNGVVRYTLADATRNIFSRFNTVAIIVPDSGKMYVSNNGENTAIPEPQMITSAEFMGNEATQVSNALDSSASATEIYRDRIVHEKKPEFDRAKTIDIFEKKKIDLSSVEEGYYSTILEKRKLEVRRGDIISANTDSSINYRIVPGQYVAQPFANELWKVFFPSSPMEDDGSGNSQVRARADFFGLVNGDSPALVYEGLSGSGLPDINGNLETLSHPFMNLTSRSDAGALKNRNCHVWNYPIIGLWCKYEELNKSVTAFDGSVIADNGNAELLGYWYLDYETQPNLSSDEPRIQVAWTDEEGIVRVSNSDDLPENHFPLCTVLHNVTNHNGGPGTETLDFYGDLSTAMQDRIRKIVGGVWQPFQVQSSGLPLDYHSIVGDQAASAAGTAFRYSYFRWEPSSSQFTTQFPLDMNSGVSPYIATIKLKFKKLRDPQAKGSLFTGNHCYPVRIRHLHLPYGESIFEGSHDQIIQNPQSPNDVGPDAESEYGYVAKIVDTNFQSGSEELLNKGVDDEESLIWVLDRYSQRKSIGMIAGTAVDYLSGGILKGAHVRFSDGDEKDIEVPLGYRGGVETTGEAVAKYTMDLAWNPSILLFADSSPGDPNGDVVFVTATPHGLTATDHGSTIKLDGSKRIPILTGVEDSLDGLYEIVNVLIAPNQIKVRKPRINDNALWVWGQGALDSFVTVGTTGALLKYYGRNYAERLYLDPVVKAIYIATPTSAAENGLLHEDFAAGGSGRHPFELGAELSYDGGSGALTYGGIDPTDATKLVFSWNGEGFIPDASGFPPFPLDFISGSAPARMTFPAMESSGLESDMPQFLRQGMDHFDHLYGTPAPSDVHPLPMPNTYLSYHKILFTCPPSFGQYINYPRALVGRNWDMFWKYNERKKDDEFPLVESQNALAWIHLVSAPNATSFTIKGTSTHMAPRLKLKNGELDITINIPDPGSNIEWNDWIYTIIEYINSSSTYFTSSLGPPYRGDFNSLYIYERVPGSSNPTRSLEVYAIADGTGSMNNVSIQMPIGVSNLSEILSTSDVFYMRNGEVITGLTAQYSHSFFKIISFLSFNEVEVQFYAGYDGTTLNQAFVIPNPEEVRYRVTQNPRIWMEDWDNDSIRKESNYRNVRVFEFRGGQTPTRFKLDSENKYGLGDGVFDSGIKPLSFSDTFINSMSKWYLSRFDKSNDLIYCDTYTMNHDRPFLGNDDKLYAIVNRHPGVTSAISRFPYIRFSMGAKTNFKAFDDGTGFYFGRAFFSKIGNELHVKNMLSKFDESGIVKHADLPYIGYVGEGGIENILHSDFEMHGIFKNVGSSNVNMGFMKWVNHGNVNTEILYNTVHPFSPEHRYFSQNQMAVTINAGLNYAYDRFDNAAVIPITPLWYSQNSQDFVVESALGPVPGVVYKYIEEHPIGVRVGGVPYAEIVTNTLPDANEFRVGQVGDGSNLVGLLGITNATAGQWVVVIGGTNPATIDFSYADTSATVANNFRSIHLDSAGRHGYFGLIKGWTFQEDLVDVNSVTRETLRGIIMKRNHLISDTESERVRREDLLNFHSVESATGVVYFENQADLMFPYALTRISRFEFRVNYRDSGNTEPANGFYFTNNFENDLRYWNGETISGTPLINNVGDAVPTVEGDFNQYADMIKIGSAYEEIFGFSMGTKAHEITQANQGGRNTVWKLSKSLAFHITVADFEGQSVWDSLGQFAELTDCLVGFDRTGNLHFEPRPMITESSKYFFTFDNFDLQNIVSLKKKPPYQHIYNEIEVIPYAPDVPKINVSLTTESERNAVTLNHDLFIRDKSIDFNEKSPNKPRPTIKAYQKDYKRKRVLLVCTNGQFDSKDAESRGLFSRFKYKMIEDLIEMRLRTDAYTGQTYLKVAHIPFDDLTNKIAFDSGDTIFIGSFETTVWWIEVEERRIHINDAIPADTRFQAGMEIVAVNAEQANNQFAAEGTGQFPTQVGNSVSGFTYSPKTFFTEIGEWTFDNSRKRPRKASLTAVIGPTSTLIPITDTTGFPEKGTVSISGQIIAYNGLQEKALVVEGNIQSDLSAGLRVYPMPIAPIQGGAANSDYNPGDIRIGGYDQVGPGCLDEYHLLDPNEDGIPYFDRAPSDGGVPITALEFYAKDQKSITYRDPNTNTTTPYNVTNDSFRARHRTFVNMSIDFNGFKFSDGDQIFLDVPGIKLKAQNHLKKVYSNYSSINRYGKRQYPATGNRFFTNASANVVARRNLDRIGKIGAEVEVVGYINDINDLDWTKGVRIIDHRMFPNYPSKQAIGYVQNMKFNQANGQVRITLLTQEA